MTYKLTLEKVLGLMKQTGPKFQFPFLHKKFRRRDEFVRRCRSNGAVAVLCCAATSGRRGQRGRCRPVPSHKARMLPSRRQSSSTGHKREAGGGEHAHRDSAGIENPTPDPTRGFPEPHPASPNSASQPNALCSPGPNGGGGPGRL